MGKATQSARAWDERGKRVCLAASLLSTALIGFQAGLRTITASSNILSSVVWVSSLVFWCVFDARLQAVRLPTSAWWLFFVGWPVAIPGYLGWTRGWRGLGMAARYMFAMLLLTVVAALVAHVGYTAYDHEQAQRLVRTR